MSNKFGEFWYIETIDHDGFDIHNEKGIVDYEITREKAIINCQRRYIKVLEEDLRVTNALYEERQRVLAAIPPCPEHGECVPHALEWIGRAKVAMGIASYAPPEGYIALSDAEIEANERLDRIFRTCDHCGQLSEDCQCDE